MGGDSPGALIRLDANAQPVATFGQNGLVIAQASLPLLQDLNGSEPPSHLVVTNARFFVADSRVDGDGSYLSLWSGDL